MGPTTGPAILLRAQPCTFEPAPVGRLDSGRRVKRRVLHSDEGVTLHTHAHDGLRVDAADPRYAQLAFDSGESKLGVHGRLGAIPLNRGAGGQLQIGLHVPPTAAPFVMG